MAFDLIAPNSVISQINSLMYISRKIQNQYKQLSNHS